MADDILTIWENGLILRMIENGIDETKATGIVTTYFAEQREYYLSERFTVKRGYNKFDPRTIKRIKAEYNGRNGQQLRERHGMSRTHFYRTIAK